MHFVVCELITTQHKLISQSHNSQTKEEKKMIQPPDQFSCFVPIAPVPKGRPRFTKSGIAYTPKETREYETSVRRYIRNAYGRDTMPMDGFLSIYLEFILPRPKTKPKQWFSNTKPDLDNYIKALLDAMDFKTKSSAGIPLGVMTNDSKASSINATKRYNIEEETPGTYIKIVHTDHRIIIIMPNVPEEKIEAINLTMRHINLIDLSTLTTDNNITHVFVITDGCHRPSREEQRLIVNKFPSIRDVTMF